MGKIYIDTSLYVENLGEHVCICESVDDTSIMLHQKDVEEIILILKIFHSKYKMKQQEQADKEKLELWNKGVGE